MLTIFVLGEPYKVTSFAMRESKKDGHLLAGHEKAFAPTKNVNHYKKPILVSYKNMTEEVYVKKNYRDEEGMVITDFPNITTNGAKKGRVGKQTSFGGIIPYIADEYDRRKTIAKEELEYHRSKLQEQPFSSKVAVKCPTFNKPKAVFGEDIPIPAREPKPEAPRPDLHEGRAFFPSNPAKKGINSTINKFPKYEANPVK